MHRHSMTATAPSRLVLASQSPGRLRLLRGAGFAPDVVVSGVDESAYADLEPAELVLALAVAKAHTVAEGLDGPPALVIGCDSMLVLDGIAFGKPVDDADAARRWRSMRGRRGVLMSGHCLLDSGTRRERSSVAETTVRFGEPTDDEIAAYVASGEPSRVAGAFTIDGLGGPFVEGVDGDWSNVVGLSLPVFRRLLAAHGVAVHDLWTRTSR